MKKISLLIISAFLLASTPTLSVHADDVVAEPEATADAGESDNSVVHSEKSQSIPVTAKKESFFYVTLPKSISLMSETGSYTVYVSGDLSEGSTVTIEPSSTIQMEDLHGKSPVSATITLDKKVWADTEINVDEDKSTSGTVSLDSSVSSGFWVGVIEFNVTLSEGE